MVGDRYRIRTAGGGGSPPPLGPPSPSHLLPFQFLRLTARREVVRLSAGAYTPPFGASFA